MNEENEKLFNPISLETEEASMTTSDFFENHEEALRKPNIVLRDSLGNLAIAILSKKENIAYMDYDILLRKLHTVICELQDAYHHCNNYFEE